MTCWKFEVSGRKFERLSLPWGDSSDRGLMVSTRRLKYSVLEDAGSSPAGRFWSVGRLLIEANWGNVPICGYGRIQLTLVDIVRATVRAIQIKQKKKKPTNSHTRFVLLTYPPRVSQSGLSVYEDPKPSRLIVACNNPII